MSGKRIWAIILSLSLCITGSQMVWAEELSNSEIVITEDDSDLPENIVDDASASDQMTCDEEIVSENEDLGSVSKDNPLSEENTDEVIVFQDEVSASNNMDMEIEGSGAADVESQDAMLLDMGIVSSLKIAPSFTIEKGDTVTLSGGVNRSLEDAIYRYIYYDGNNWCQIAAFDSVREIQWSPETVGTLLVAFQIQYQGMDYNAFQTLTVNPSSQKASVKGLSVAVDQKDYWNASVKLKGSVDNPADEDLVYQYLTYNGSYWTSISQSSVLEEIEWIPPQPGAYSLCFQIYDQSGNVLGQWFSAYETIESSILINNIYVKITNNNQYNLSADVSTNDQFAEYRWLYYDLSKKTWGEISDWSRNTDTIWCPANGAYWIYVEGKTTDGKTADFSVGQMVETLYIQMNGIKTTGDKTDVQMDVDVTTNDTGAEYRWLYYDLEKQTWHTIREWSSQKTASWKPEEEGTYWIHVEGRTRTGVVSQYTIGYVVSFPTIEISGINVTKMNPGLKLELSVVADSDGSEYRWLYYDLSNQIWGTIEDWSNKKTVEWYPQKGGSYWIHVEAKNASGQVSSYTMGYYIEPFKIALSGIIVSPEKENVFNLDVNADTDDMNAEYRWLYYDLSSGCWGLIQDWSKNKTAVWETECFGTYWIHVEGRTIDGSLSEVTIGYSVEQFYVNLGNLNVYTPDWSTYYIQQVVETNDPNLVYTYMIYDIKNDTWTELPQTGSSTYWQPEVSGGYWVHAVVTDSAGDSYCNTIGYSVVFRIYDEHAKSIMRNIMYAVETGGQIYGRVAYNTFCPAFNITQKETAITIGGGGWFASEAQKLLKLIREKDPETFALLDTAGISYDLDNCDWSYYGSDGQGNRTIERGSEKALCIQKLISTSVGIEIQNQLLDEEAEKYVNDAQKLGVNDLKARMFCANIRHLGGYSAMSSVIRNCKADGLPLTMEGLWISMRNHADPAGNGVGSDRYKSRHEKVMLWLNTYL